MKQQISFILELAYTLSVTLYKYYSHVKRQFYASSWHLVGFILCILVSTYPQKVYTQEAVYVDYIESLNSIPDTNFVSLPILKKEFRLKSNSCISFKIISEANVPDSVTKCLEVAADIWRSCLNLKSNNSINLQLKWEDLPNDEDIKISVAYFLDKDKNHVPASLYYSLNPDLSSNNSHDYDAIITINKNVNWNCGYNIENNYGSCNLNYAMLRSIAIALGFGSSLSLASNPQPIGFSGILLAKRQNSFYCTYFLHNRNVADTKSPYPIKRLEVIRWFNQKSMVFNQSLS